MKPDYNYSCFRSILVKDLPILFTSYFPLDVNDTLRQLKINTLEDLFIAYEKGFFSDRRRSIDKALIGQVEMLLSYYTGTSLIASDILDERINIKNVNNIEKNNQNIANWLYQRNIHDKLIRLGITTEEISMLYKYCIYNQNDILGNNISILELIKKLVEDQFFQFIIISKHTNKKDLVILHNLKFKAQFLEQYLSKEKEHSESECTIKK